MIELRTHTVAREAYVRVAARRDCPKKKEYGALAHRLPSMILGNGLAQATGFLLAKGSKEHAALLDDLNAVLGVAGASVCKSGEDLHQHVIQSDLGRIMVLTRRALEAGGWIKRYVQGVLRIDAIGDSDESRDDKTEAAS